MDRSTRAAARRWSGGAPAGWRVAAVGVVLTVLGGCTTTARPATTSREASNTGLIVATPAVSTHALEGAAASGTATSSPASAASGVVPQGTVLSRVIPGGASGFTGRPAWIYLPPVLSLHPNTVLPVLELLHGTPGGPHDWLTEGHLAQAANAFAAQHGGAAPVIVMPDINGSKHADSECVTVAGADVEQYLTVQVPDYLRTHLPAERGQLRLTVAGLSEGGMCSAMLALRHPSEYPLFGDMSGLGRPTVGRTDDPALTVQDIFGGSAAAYDAHDPLWILARQKFPGLAGWFVCGQGDVHTCTAQKLLAPAARAAGVAVTTSVAAGKHDWQLWSTALPHFLAWMWGRTRQ